MCDDKRIAERDLLQTAGPSIPPNISHFAETCDVDLAVASQQQDIARVMIGATFAHTRKIGSIHSQYKPKSHCEFPKKMK